MEIRRLTICMVMFVLAISHCSEAHSMQRRQAVNDDIYDDQLLGDEATDDEAMNDETDQPSAPQQPQIPVVIATTPTHYQVKAGEDVKLECKVSPDMPVVVSWDKNTEHYFLGSMPLHREEVRYNVSKVGPSNDLVIKNAQVEDSGVYTCGLMVKNNPVAINHTLLVTEKPKIISVWATNNGSVIVGGKLTMNCIVTASPRPSLLWSRMRKDQEVNERLTEKDADFQNQHINQRSVYSMHISNVTEENAGKYFCYAFNEFGNDQAEFIIIVNGKPQVHVPKTFVNSAIGIKAVLQCVAHGDANPHIRWYLDGVRVEDSSTAFIESTKGGHSNLTVRPLSNRDFGAFTCEAENDYGKHNRSIELVQSPVVDDLEVDGPKLSWTVHSHQPIEEMEVQIKPTNGEGEWQRLKVPVPAGGHHEYDVSFTLEDKQIPPGEYLVTVKVKNTKSWGGTYDPAVVTIQDAQSLHIQTASVVRGNSAHSIRPVHTVLSTILMYLLVRMLY